jgi:hypothetical protein
MRGGNDSGLPRERRNWIDAGEGAERVKRFQREARWTPSWMAVGVRSSTTSVEADTHELFPVSLPANVGFPYDVTSDGQRFLVLEAMGGALGSAPLNVVLNWQAGLKR